MWANSTPKITAHFIKFWAISKPPADNPDNRENKITIWVETGDPEADDRAGDEVGNECRGGNVRAAEEQTASLGGKDGGSGGQDEPN